MRHLLIVIATFLATPLMAQTIDVEVEPVVELTETHQAVIDAAGNMLLAAAESKLAEMANLTPENFLTEDMVRARLRAYRDAGVNTLRLSTGGKDWKARTESLAVAVDLVKRESADW